MFHEHHEIRAKKRHSRASRKWSFFGHFVVGCLTREWFLCRFLVNLYYSWTSQNKISVKWASQNKICNLFPFTKKNGVHEQHKTTKTAYCCFSIAIPLVDTRMRTRRGRDEDDDKDNYGDDDNYAECHKIKLVLNEHHETRYGFYFHS